MGTCSRSIDGFDIWFTASCRCYEVKSCGCFKKGLVMKQILAILGMNLRTILARSGSSIVIIIGIAGSVAVMVSLLAMAEGLAKLLQAQVRRGSP